MHESQEPHPEDERDGKRVAVGTGTECEADVARKERQRGYRRIGFCGAEQ